MASTTHLSTCPFCNGSYLQLGKHLPHCKQRDGRDYTHLLSAKTLQKRSLSKKSECPKCHRLFKRLDTHLRVSATCKEINSIPPPNNSYMHNGLQQLSQNQFASEDAMFLHLDSNSANTATPVPAVSALTTATINTSSPLPKANFSLPTTAEGWEQADSFFKTSLVPATIAASSPQVMNRVLCEGIYSYFASTYGTKHTKVRETKKIPPHNRALKEVERKKKEAKTELRSARRSGSPEMVHSLAHHFISLVRAHSQLKRASNAHLMKRDVKAARERCHRDYKGCTRVVLDGGLGQEVPMFSDDDATTFFKQAYCSSPRNYVQPEWMPAGL